MIACNSQEFIKVGNLLEQAKKLAIEYRLLTEKPLGITSEVAEYEAAKKLNCTLCDARTPGHDLIDSEGKKVQVKGRVIPDSRSHRVPTILKNTNEKPWDYVVLVLFDEKYNVLGIYKADEKTIELELERERPKGGQKRRNIPVRDFIHISKQI